MKKVFTAAVLLACLSLAASQDASVRDALAAELPLASAADVSVHAYGDKNKACQEWTDGCRACTRPESGDAVCSNIGISCQPKAINCTRKTEEKK